ncbi:MAG: helix-turn-helix domain-containing protein [Clostridia bacterium]|nr:helix-turn-helix domain-containing protein [Clostridia bacterium]
MHKLQTLVDLLTCGRNLHICIHDLSGILKAESRELEFENKIHSKKFCSIAKETKAGLELCLRCKAAANTKAVKEGVPFTGHCPLGIWEAAYPVVHDGTVKAIVYVGNYIVNTADTEKRIEKTCRLTGADSTALKSLLSECEITDNISEAMKIAGFTGDYMLMLPDAEPSSDSLHWAVKNLKNYADTWYEKNLSLKSLAALYFINEKYIGRLFKKQIGMSFREYLCSVRLHRAEQLLASSDRQVIDIALECGFENVTYFNRVFAKKHGMTPLQYRAEKIRLKKQ